MIPHLLHHFPAKRTGQGLAVFPHALPSSAITGGVRRHTRENLNSQQSARSIFHPNVLDINGDMGFCFI
ncbi:MAG: hypothetical protein IKP72_02665, partial [Clostridia bacterium]|nr:hypothetical protein [Clostridia bacterium]